MVRLEKIILFLNFVRLVNALNLVCMFFFHAKIAAFFDEKTMPIFSNYQFKYIYIYN